MKGKWGELQPGDVVLQGPLQDWQHAWLVLWREPSVTLPGWVDFATVDLDTGAVQSHTRKTDGTILSQYDVLRAGGYPIHGEA